MRVAHGDAAPGRRKVIPAVPCVASIVYVAHARRIYQHSARLLSGLAQGARAFRHGALLADADTTSRLRINLL